MQKNGAAVNKGQKECFGHILHFIKISDKPFYSFLSGGAGTCWQVSSCYYIKALYQAVLKHYIQIIPQLCELK